MQQALGATSYIIIPFFKLLTEVCRESFFQTFCTAGSGLQDPQLEACSCPISVEGCEGANMCQCVCSFVCLPACLSVCLFVYLILFDFICLSLYVVQRSYESYDIWWCSFHGFMASWLARLSQLEFLKTFVTMLGIHCCCGTNSAYTKSSSGLLDIFTTHMDQMWSQMWPDVIMWFDFFIAISAIFSRIHQESNRSRAATKMIKMH